MLLTKATSIRVAVFPSNGENIGIMSVSDCMRDLSRDLSLRHESALDEC